MILPDAPGWPGMEPRWTSSAKSGVGTALSAQSQVWYTISHGILNEVYFPRVDRACTRDCGFLVLGPDGFFSEEKRHLRHEVQAIEDGVPAFRLHNTCAQGRYRIEKEIFADQNRPTVMLRFRFIPLIGALRDYRVFVLLSPHLGNRGFENTAFVGDYKGVPMLFAERGSLALALASQQPLGPNSAGFVGKSDGWQSLSNNHDLTPCFQRAENGNVALCAEIILPEDGTGTICISFGNNAMEAGHNARSSLLHDLDYALQKFAQPWRDWQSSLRVIPPGDGGRDLYRTSMAVIRTHEAKNFPGAFIASLSIPWGFSKSDDDLGGYHLVWPRDLVESVGGLIAAGAVDDVHRVLRYLHVTQEADGHWPQNMWIDGRPYWGGTQLDEAAFPILLIDLARRELILTDDRLRHLWDMVRRGASFLVRNGPVTQEDRWEEDAGYSPFTLAVEIAALLVAADLAEQWGEADLAPFLRETADFWNDSIERWVYATDTALSKKVGVQGYYVRIAPPETADAASPLDGFVPIKNRSGGVDNRLATEIVSPDALALVRFGLRAADDPRIVNTVKVIDATLRKELPQGPCWYRYNDDGYGEHPDGLPFDGWGQGRPWPLLTGERAHYELAAGRVDEARRLMRALEGFANPGGLIPEQVWDADDIPSQELYFGQPAGSAMPLVWAHSEYVKLRRSLHDGRVFDMPPHPVARYQKDKVASRLQLWRFNSKARTLPAGRTLRIETLARGRVKWTTDNWATQHENEVVDSKLGVYYFDLPSTELPVGTLVIFTFYWLDAQKWEGENFVVTVAGESSPSGNGRASAVAFKK
ncbi:MAG: glucan 1,4-alpha-glucosidase [Armatimonadetes bacterium]|nr:glucan 1,4-alpha-glucosidase [Armatimonadota bacterium]